MNSFDINTIPNTYIQSELLANDGLPHIVALFLMAEIGRRQLYKGDRFPISEKDLSGALDVARGTVNQAWRLLEKRGIVKVQQGIGIIILKPELIFEETTLDVFFKIRREAEKGLAWDAAVRANDEDIKLIEDQLETFTQAVAKLSKLGTSNILGFDDQSKLIFQLFSSDLSFHSAVHKASKDPWMIMIAEIAEARTQVMWYHGFRLPDTLTDLIDLHVKIFEAIVAHDANEAVKSVERHFEHAYKSGKLALETFVNFSKRL